MDYEDELDIGTPEPSSPSKARAYGHKRNKSSSNSLPSTAQTRLLCAQSRTMRDLEQLILAFDALERFAGVCEKIDNSKRRRDSGTIKNLLAELQDALDGVSVHIDAVLYDWLISGQNGKHFASMSSFKPHPLTKTYRRRTSRTRRNPQHLHTRTLPRLPQRPILLSACHQQRDSSPVHEPRHASRRK